jgi:hypothetical protein
MPHFIRISRSARPTRSDKTQRTIFLRVFPSWENRREFTFSTKVIVPENRWNKITKSVSGTGIESNRLNTQLSQLEVETQNVFQQYINGVVNPDREDLKSEIEFKLFNKGSGKSKEMLVSDLFERYIALHRSDLGEKRIERYKFVQSTVDDFHVQRFGKQNIGLEVINKLCKSVQNKQLIVYSLKIFFKKISNFSHTFKI